MRAVLQALLDIPSVLAAAAPGHYRLDAAKILATPDVVVLGDLDGMVIFYHEGHRIYDGHYVFPPWTRGADAYQRAREFIRAMFMDHGAAALSGEVPIARRATRLMTRKLGFTPMGECVNDHVGPCIKYGLTRAAWLQSQ